MTKKLPTNDAKNKIRKEISRLLNRDAERALKTVLKGSPPKGKLFEIRTYK